MKAQRSYRSDTSLVRHAFQLPTDSPRRTGPHPGYAGETFQYSSRLCFELHTFAERERVSLFVALLTAFETLLYRYTGLDEFALDSPRTVNRAPHAEAFIDLAIDLAAVKDAFRGDPGFRTLVHGIDEAVQNACQRRPPTPVLNLNRTDKDPPTAPESEVRFALLSGDLENAFPEDGTPAGAADPVDYELFLTVSSETGELTGRFLFRSDLFSSDTIKRMSGHFEMLLESAIADPDRRVSTLSIVPPAERHRLLVEFNSTEREFPRNTCIHQLFEAQAKRTPRRTALIVEDRRLSYQELDNEANRLARYLLKRGVAARSLVGLYLEGSLEKVVGLLAILKVGATYIPLDPSYPVERLAFMLNDSGVRVVLTQQRLLSAGSFLNDLEVICMDGQWMQEDAHPAVNPGIPLTPENFAYIIYTSGSTGKPKGIPIAHCSVVNLLHSMQAELGLTANDCLLAVTTVSFDMSVVEIFLPLSVGATVMPVTRDIAIDGAALAKRLSDPRITLIQATPATWHLLLEAGWEGNSRLKLISGGEALPRELATQLQKRSAILWNMYGPTETTVYSSVYQVTDAVGPVSIGHPISNTRMYVLDRHRQPQPIGVPGEIYIGGMGLSPGYLNRPELTAAAFVADVVSGQPGARLYKTGDFGRYRSDGNIEYLGRGDRQIKIRGFRVELQEIEAVLSRNVSVQRAVVSAREIAGEKKLVAYVVPKAKHELTGGALSQYVRAALPAFMTPSAFVFVERLPLTPNRKIDFKALETNSLNLSGTPENYVAPSTPLEGEIVAVWEEVLDVRPIGIRDNFFDLGGDSLLALRVVLGLERSLAKEIPVAAMYQAPTAEQLAILCTDAGGLPFKSLVAPLQPNGTKPPFFWIHGDKSNLTLPRHIGSDQPVYGVMHQGHDGGPARYTTVEDIANHYLEEIRRVQPQGPYLLGGYCFGGTIAFEIAHQLKKRAEAVDLVVMLDPDAFETPEFACRRPKNSSSGAQALFSTGKLRHHAHNLKQLSFREVMDYLSVRVRDRIRAASKIAKTTFCKLCFTFGYPLPPSLYSHYMLGVYDSALKRYVPEPYSGRIIVWKTASDAYDASAWETLGPDVEVARVQCKHAELLDQPYIQVWASHLADELQHGPVGRAI